MRRVFFVVALVACGEERSFIAHPDGIAAKTKLFVQRSPLTVEVIEGEPKLERSIDDGDLELYLLAYDESAAELGLEAGPLPLETPCRPCALLHPDEVFVSRDGAAFALHPGRPEWLFPALVPDADLRCGGCPVKLEAELISDGLGSVGGAFLLVPWTEAEVLLVNASDGLLSRLTADGAAEPLCRLDPTLAGINWAVLSRAEELWLARDRGVFWSLMLSELHPDRPCGEGLEVRSPPLGVSISRFAGPHDQNVPNLYALASDPSGRKVHRFHAGTWTVSATLSDTPGEASMAHASDGWTYAVDGGEHLARMRGDQSEVRLVDGGEFDRELTVVADVPGFGLLIGDRYEGLLASNESGDFVPVGKLPLAEGTGDRPRGIVAVGDGVLYATSRGEVRYFSREAGYCASQLGLFGRESGWNIVSLSGPVVFSGAQNLYRAELANRCPPHGGSRLD